MAAKDARLGKHAAPSQAAQPKEAQVHAAQAKGAPAQATPAKGAQGLQAAPAKTARLRRGKVTAWDFATSGTHEDARPMPAIAWVFAALAFAVLLVPSIGMLWARTDATSENRELAAAPSVLAEDGAFNVNVLSDAGAYFDDHFAYRNYLVSANASLKAPLLASPTDQVVVGTDGWLYFGGTLPDYLGQGQLSNRALRNIAHNLALVQQYAHAHDAQFVLAVAPNKNTLYPQGMPYYYLRWDGAGNFERLKPYLDAEGVNYVDLRAFFEDQDQVEYLLTDSHWSNHGALLVANQLQAALGRGEIGADLTAFVEREDFLGDIESMLHPENPRLEANQYYAGYNDEEAGSLLWSYVEGVSVTDDTIVTRSDAGAGGLLMFRDSFGNSTLPFMASAYENATFTKLIPYDVAQMSRESYDAVVVERTERHLAYLAQSAPIMSAPRIAPAFQLPAGSAPSQPLATLDAHMDGPYLVLSGTVDASAAEEDMRIYLGVSTGDGEEVVYEPFWYGSTDESGAILEDYSYQAMLNPEAVDLSAATVRVLGVVGDAATCLAAYDHVAVSQ